MKTAGTESKRGTYACIAAVSMSGMAWSREVKTGMGNCAAMMSNVVRKAGDDGGLEEGGFYTEDRLRA